MKILIGLFLRKNGKYQKENLLYRNFHNTVKSLDQVIDVDYYLPGCSPEPYLTMNAINKILSGDLPAKGTVLAPAKSLCDVCSRSETKPEKLAIEKIKRVLLHNPIRKNAFWLRVLSVWDLSPDLAVRKKVMDAASVLICPAGVVMDHLQV